MDELKKKREEWQSIRDQIVDLVGEDGSKAAEWPEDEHDANMSRFDDLKKQEAAIKAEVAELEKAAQKKAAQLASIQQALSGFQPINPTSQIGRDGGSLVEKPKPEAEKPKQYAVPMATGVLRHFKGTVNGRSAEERAYRFGHMLRAFACQQLPNRYGHLTDSVRFVQDYIAPMNAAMGEGAGDLSGGRFLVPTEFSTDMIMLRLQYGVARRILRNEAMTSETKNVPKELTELTAHAVGENAAGTESNPTFTDVELVARKWMVLGRFSKELDADSAVNLGDILAGQLARAFAKKEDDSAFNGDGTSTYHGIVGIRTKLQDVDGAGTDSTGLNTQGTGTTWGAIVLGDFHDTLALVPSYSRGGQMEWVCHPAFYYGVMQALELASGGVPAMEIREGNLSPRPLFLGIPVEFSEDYPSATAVTTVSCTVGDHSLGGIFGDRRRDSVEFSDQVYVNSQSVWERDQIAIKGVSRWDIKIHGCGDATNAGPICGLETGT